MKKIKYYFVLAFIFLCNVLAFAQDDGWDDQDGPPSPDGLGSPATPIDMYTFILIAAALVLLLVFAKKYKKQAA